jgi:hypothetical protein
MMPRLRAMFVSRCRLVEGKGSAPDAFSYARGWARVLCGRRRIVGGEQRRARFLVEFFLEGVGTADGPRFGQRRPFIDRLEPTLEVGERRKQIVAAGEYVISSTAASVAKG